MKQKIIFYCLGLITALGTWIIYDRIEAYSRNIEVTRYMALYEKEEFMNEAVQPKFEVDELYKMKLISGKGEDTNINDKEKIIFLSFWATWCRPCVEEMPAIQELYERSKENVDFYLLTYEDINKAKEFINNKGFTFPIFSYQNKKNLPSYFQFNGGAIPDTYIIYNGEIKFHHLGAAPWNSYKVDSLFSSIYTDEKLGR